MSWTIVGSNRPSKPLTYARIERYRPREWRQSFSERDHWHQFRIDQKRRRAGMEPIATLGSLLTAAGQ